MADQNVINPTTDEKGSVSQERLDRARRAGAEKMTDTEAVQLIDQRAQDRDLVTGAAAQTIGKVRGVGEAFGIPTDALAVSVGDIAGKGGDVQKYLKDLKEYRPGASAYGELSGQVAGTIAGGELLGGGSPARAASVGGRIVQGAAEAGVRGGLENLIIGSTHDVNETALGNADLAGEKLYAQMPKHFGVGLAAGTVLGGAGTAAGEVLGPLIKGLGKKAGQLSDEALVREFGAEVRGRAIPKSAAELETGLVQEQKAFREASQAKALGEKEAVISRQSTEAAEQVKRSQAALEELKVKHQEARDTLATQHGEASSNAVKLGEELTQARRQLRSLADDLDKVKGAEKVNVRNVIDTAIGKFRPDPLTPASPRAQALFQEWAANLEGKTHLGFKETQNLIKSIDVMETRQRVVSGWGNDPEVAKAFSAMRDAAKAEFDRASEATAAGVSEAKNLSQARIKEQISSLDKAHKEASGNVDNIQKAILDFERGAKLETRAAERQQVLESRAFQKGQAQEVKGLPKAEKATPVDTLLRRVQARPQSEGFGAMGGMGALVSLLHGNPAGAAMSLVGGFAAHTAKAEGNLLAARTLRSLADHIATADGSIAKLAGRAVGRYARQAPEKVAEDRPKRGEITFERASKTVRDAQANPLIIEQRVRLQAEGWAQQAPNVYASLLQSSLRAQAFLESKLPPPRTDPYSLTPHLEVDDLSDTEKYDFVQYARACADPLKAMREVVDGDGTPQQVEAVAAVYPQVYAQTKAEVGRYIATLTKPLDYERSVNVGTLLQMDTSEVMTAEFQTMQADMYSARQEEEKGPSVSAPKGVNSRLSKSSLSASQQMQTGET